ncbi:MAG: hypothetical protein R2911_35900 [Caldilineaceae bacterium]
MAISGRLRLAALDADGANPSPNIVALVEPYVAGHTALFAAQDGGANSGRSGVADELAAATGDSRYADPLIHTANRYLVTKDGVLAALRSRLSGGGYAP